MSDTVPLRVFFHTGTSISNFVKYYLNYIFLDNDICRIEKRIYFLGFLYLFTNE